MDKTSRALIGVEDNAEDIRALKARLESAELALERNKIACEIGQYVTINNKSYSTFGTYRIDGPTIFVMAPGDTATRELYFNDKAVLTGSGTLIYAVDSGEGELKICANAASPRLLIIGEATKIE